MTIHDLNIYYDAYLKQRRKTLKYIKSRNGIIPSFGKDPVSKRDFELDLKAAKLENPKESYVAIAKKYAKEQLYEYSFKEAERRAEAHVRSFGGQVDVNLIQQYRMQNRRELYDAIQVERTSLKSKGFTNDQIEIYISQEFFGSE